MEHKKIEHYFSRLEEVFMEMSRRLHVELAGQMVAGITGSQFLVLKIISGRGRVTVSGVADGLGVSLSAITALADRLVKAGLVVRSRDENDRRLVWLEVTERGREVFNRCNEGRKKVGTKYFGRLGEADLRKLIEIYEKLLSFMRAENAGEKAGR